MFVRCFEAVLNGLGELSDDKDGVKNGQSNAVVLKVVTTSLLLVGCTNSCVQRLVPDHLHAVKT